MTDDVLGKVCSMLCAHTIGKFALTSRNSVAKKSNVLFTKKEYTFRLENITLFENLRYLIGIELTIENNDYFLPKYLVQASFDLDCTVNYHKLIDNLNIETKRNDQDFRIISKSHVYIFIRNEIFYSNKLDDLEWLILNYGKMYFKSTYGLAIIDQRNFLKLGNLGNTSTGLSINKLIEPIINHGYIDGLLWNYLLNIYIHHNGLLYADNHMKKYLQFILDEYNELEEMYAHYNDDYDSYDPFSFSFPLTEMLVVLNQPQPTYYKFEDAPGVAIKKDIYDKIFEQIKKTYSDIISE